MSMRKHAKLAALGAIGVSVGALALFALIASVSRHTPNSGVDSTTAVVTMLSVAVPVAAIIAAHLAFAKILFDESRIESRGQSRAD